LPHAIVERLIDAGIGTNHPGKDALSRSAHLRKTMHEEDSMPAITTHFVDASTIAVVFEVGKKLSEGTIVPYLAKTGDTVGDDRVVVRDGKEYGVLVGKDNSRVHVWDTFEEDPALSFFRGTNGSAPVDQESSYKVTAGGQTYTPSEIFRKSAILESARIENWPVKFVEQQTVHIKLNQPLNPGDTISIDFGDSRLTDLSTTYQPKTQRSDAVHVTQIGFDPDDPLKVGFLSTWLGENAGVTGETQSFAYAAGTKFQVINAETGKVAYNGTITLQQGADQTSNFSENYSLTNVYKMDFSTLKTAGTYHIYVDGVGKSYDFKIGENVWQEAFEVSARGFFHQRSGIAVTEPYSDWTKPRDQHPSDGFVVKQSTANIMDTFMGLNLKDQSSFEALVKGETQQIVTATGGWRDAADFDRRIQHLDAVNDMLLLAELKPGVVKNTDLNIPESSNTLPDLIDEALWTLDFFKSLQRADGAVSGGIEFEEHPLSGESSWTVSQRAYAYAPDAWSSYKYAATAAKAYAQVAPYDQARANTYLDTAKKAMLWAEANTPDYAAVNLDVMKERNLAAAELYRATGDEQWNTIYRASSVYAKSGTVAWNEHMVEAAFVYSQTKHAGVDKTIQKRGSDAILSEAEFILQFSKKDGFLTPINPWAQVTFTGQVTNMEAAALLFPRAHALTGDKKWHEAMIAATQFSAGANPTNMSYTTGIGVNQPREIMDIDADALGLGPKPGMTIYGLWGPREGSGQDWWTGITNDAMPYQYGSPVNESYAGWGGIAPLGEYTVMQGNASAMLLWGYLAGTDPGGQPAGRLIKGGRGADTLKGTKEANVLHGLDGNDTIHSGDGGDLVRGGTGDDTVQAGAGNDVLYGDAGNDVLRGAAGNDKIIGGSGSDVLSGWTGNDWMDGGTGNDDLWGGTGINTMTGGAGKDRFVFHKEDTNTDMITDFSVADDTLVFDNTVFLGLGPKGALAAAAFKAVSAASNSVASLIDASDRIIYNKTTGTVLYDVDGSGSKAAVAIAMLTTGLGMTAADVLLI
jgi:endoglucanase